MKESAPLREQVLDGTRGMAIVLVLIWHCFFLTPNSIAAELYNRFAGLGWLGVDLFFVLSGFLITRILIAERQRPDYYSRFYLRRVLRIFPAYYFTLMMVYLLVPLIYPPIRDAQVLYQWPWFLLHAQNWGMATQHAAYDWPGIHHFWSLAIEEQFYLVWPLLVAMTPPERLRRVCIVLIIGSIATKLVLVGARASWSAVYVTTTARLEGLAYGAFIAALTPATVLFWRRWITCLGGLGLAGLALVAAAGASMTSKLTLIWAIPCASALFGWLLFAIREGTLPRFLAGFLQSRILVWFGRYSYGLYLCHYVIYWCLRPYVPAWLGDSTETPDNASVLLLGVMTLTLSILYARIMYAMIEAPALRLRDRWRKPPQTSKLGID